MRSGFVILSWTERRRSGISYLVPPSSPVTNNHLECTMCVNKRTGELRSAAVTEETQTNITAWQEVRSGSVSCSEAQ